MITLISSKWRVLMFDIDDDYNDDVEDDDSDEIQCSTRITNNVENDLYASEKREETSTETGVVVKALTYAMDYNTMLAKYAKMSSQLLKRNGSQEGKVDTWDNTKLCSDPDACMIMCTKASRCRHNTFFFAAYGKRS